MESKNIEMNFQQTKFKRQAILDAEIRSWRKFHKAVAAASRQSASQTVI